MIWTFYLFIYIFKVNSRSNETKYMNKSYSDYSDAIDEFYSLLFLFKIINLFLQYVKQPIACSTAGPQRRGLRP